VWAANRSQENDMLSSQPHGLTTQPDTPPKPARPQVLRARRRQGLAGLAMLALGMPVAHAGGATEVAQALFTPALADAPTQALLDTRNATVHLAYGGGFATAHKEGTVGSLDPVPLDGPATVSYVGADSFVGSYLSWTVNWQMNWQIEQTWAIDASGQTLSGSGYTLLAQTHGISGPGCPSCAASVNMTVHNWQDFQFTLDAPSAFVFHSDVTLDQGVQINRWDERRLRWLPFVVSVEGGVTDRSGTLDAGRWQVVNSRSIDVISSGTPSMAEAWSFSLTLPGTRWAALAVPEPSSALLLGCGVGLLAWRRRAGAARDRLAR
jgi:hypothetical protein